LDENLHSSQITATGATGETGEFFQVLVWWKEWFTTSLLSTHLENGFSI